MVRVYAEANDIVKRSRKTDLKFTAAEVRHIVCLLSHNPKKPSPAIATTASEWKKTHKSLCEKFRSIDRRF